MPALPVIAAVGTVGGLALTAKGMSDAKKAQEQARQDAANAKVDVAGVANLAEQQAARNIQNSLALEQQYTPENAALRKAGIENLLAYNAASPELTALLSSRYGSGSGTYGGDVGAQSVTVTDVESPTSVNSQLLQSAVDRAAAELALGGELPQDVKNLVARNALAKAGRVGTLQLGRDITARDLGLTSLDLAQRRLANAQSLGQADLAAGQYNSSAAQRAAEINAAARNAAGLSNAQLAQSAAQFNAGQRQQSGQFDAQFLQSLMNGEFNRLLSTAQFGQSLTPPIAGLDPSAIANLAVGNQNAQTAAGLQASQIGAAGAQGMTQLGGQLIGAGVGGLANYYGKPQTPAPYVPFSSPPANSASNLVKGIF